MAVEVFNAAQVIYELMRDDPVLIALFGGEVVIVKGLAPTGTRGKYISHQLQSSPNTNALGGYRVFARPLFLVRGVSTESWDEAKAIADQVDELLTGRVAGTFNSVHVGKFMRESDYEEHPTLESVEYFMLGGYYRSIVR